MGLVLGNVPFLCCIPICTKKSIIPSGAHYVSLHIKNSDEEKSKHTGLAQEIGLSKHTGLAQEIGFTDHNAHTQSVCGRLGKGRHSSKNCNTSQSVRERRV
jgi:hypothetical protein